MGAGAVSGRRALPGYWTNESTGAAASAVGAYLAGGPMTPDQRATMRAYLAQWMAADWKGSEIEGLRARIAGLDSRTAFAKWFEDAGESGIDPL